VRGLALACIVLGATPAGAGDFMDTTITFVASDDDVLAGAGETIPSSTGLDFRPRPGNALFFENYDTRNTGEETRTHLVLHKEFEPYFRRLTPEAAMVIEWDANRTASDNARFEETGGRRAPGGIRDDGSYVALHYSLDAERKRRVSAVLFPFDSDRMRLGYSWELTWGGRDAFILGRSVPGVKLSIEDPDWYGYVGAKTARTQAFVEDPGSPEQNENEAVYAVLVGAGYQITENLLAEVGGGWFEKGSIPIERAVKGEKLNLVGGSAQLVWSDGVKSTRSVDTKLYRNNGEATLRKRSLEPRPTGYLVSTELNMTSQTLEDSDKLGQSKSEAGVAGDINARFESGAWSLNADLVVRSLEFLVQATPGLYPFGTVPDQLETSPEVFVSVGADYLIPSFRMIPGLTVGVQSPASVQGEIVNSRGEAAPATTIVRRTKDVFGKSFLEPTQLPTGVEAKPIYSARLDIKSYLSDLMMLRLELQLTHNGNKLRLDPETGVRDFENPWVLGVGLLAQARF
jgi:hypothetical protein